MYQRRENINYFLIWLKHNCKINIFSLKPTLNLENLVELSFFLTSITDENQGLLDDLKNPLCMSRIISFYYSATSLLARDSLLTDFMLNHLCSTLSSFSGAKHIGSGNCFSKFLNLTFCCMFKSLEKMVKFSILSENSWTPFRVPQHGPFFMVAEFLHVAESF